MRSVIFIASPFRRFRNSCGDEAEHITFPNHMDDIEELVVGCEADTRLPCLFLGAGVLVAGELVEKDLSGLLEPYAVPGGITGRFIAIPDKALPIQRRVHIHIAIVYTPLAGWLRAFADRDLRRSGTVSPSSVLIFVGLKIHKLGPTGYRNRETKGKD
jgi:hypothetical protein